MKILLVNGPNLNLLGTREPQIYGNISMEIVLEKLRKEHSSHEILYFQSNHEGALIDRLQEDDFDALVINPGALSHYSFALADCLKNLSQKKSRCISVKYTNEKGFVKNRLQHLMLMLFYQDLE